MMKNYSSASSPMRSTVLNLRFGDDAVGIGGGGDGDQFGWMRLT